MKITYAAAYMICLLVTAFPVTAMAAESNMLTAGIESADQSELLPSDVLVDTEQLEIRKVYELSPDMDPGRLPREGFERAESVYECTDILREVIIGEEFKMVTVTETAESKNNDTATVLDLFSQYKEYTDEEGFAGSLLLNTSTIKSEISEYGSSSKPYMVSRSYPNLSGSDTQHIPKTLDDNGRTLQLQDVQWQVDNTFNVDDYEVGNRYTAVAIYGGTKTSSYVKGYTVTADYTGEVSRKGVSAIRYTVIFTGTAIPEPEPEEFAADLDEASANGGNVGELLPILISSLATLGSGACLYFTLNKRKETTSYETATDTESHDTDADDVGSDSGVTGDGGGL